MATWVQGALVVLLGLLGIIDGLTTSLSVRRTNPNLYDVVGPDRYVTAVGLGLLVLGIAYLVTGRHGRAADMTSGQTGRAALLATVAVLVAYGVLLQYFGYLASTLAFFLVMFRIMGVMSWRSTAILAVASTTIYYVFFVHVARLVFPHGLLDLWG